MLGCSSLNAGGEGDLSARCRAVLSQTISDEGAVYADSTAVGRGAGATDADPALGQIVDGAEDAIRGDKLFLHRLARMDHGGGPTVIKHHLGQRLGGLVGEERGLAREEHVVRLHELEERVVRRVAAAALGAREEARRVHAQF